MNLHLSSVSFSYICLNFGGKMNIWFQPLMCFYRHEWSYNCWNLSMSEWKSWRVLLFRETSKSTYRILALLWNLGRFPQRSTFLQNHLDFIEITKKGLFTEKTCLTSPQIVFPYKKNWTIFCNRTVCPPATSAFVFYRGVTPGHTCNILIWRLVYSCKKIMVCLNYIDVWKENNWEVISNRISQDMVQKKPKTNKSKLYTIII